ncbi:hypothetical protein HJC23_007566 [Cyclotella cryptica]|uniref:PIN-like protein n=1 Tax=Cyclotella cryptica TaxID=29204 RepID=A0ABD3QRI6_9STRA
MGSLAATFEAALRAVGTAATMAFAGFYLHRRNFVTPSGKKMMALLSQQVTIIYCPRNKSTADPTALFDNDETICPSVADRLADVWIILLWPFFVVACGLVTGYVAARISNTPKSQVGSCLVACAFGNSTGLVMTLLTVIHDQFGATTELGSVDATAFLSIYLLLYPILQWGVGGWLMAPEEVGEEEKRDIDNTDIQLVESVQHVNSSNEQDIHNNSVEESVLFRSFSERPASSNHNSHHRRIQSLHIPHLLNNEHFESLSAVKDAGEEEFGGVAPLRIIFGKNDEEHCRFLSTGRIDSTGSGLATMIKELSFLNLCIEGIESSASCNANGEKPSSLEPLAIPRKIRENTPLLDDIKEFTSNGFDDPAASLASKEEMKSIQASDLLPLTATLLRVATKVFQPPVIGALTGLLIASFPQIRGILVNIRAGSEEPAPLQWMFDGIYAVGYFSRFSLSDLLVFSQQLNTLLSLFYLSHICPNKKVGQSAVPINMTILGINLSSTFQRNESDDGKGKMLSNQTMFAVLVGKMLVMPLIGIATTWLLQQYFIDLPDGKVTYMSVTIV